MAKELFSGQFFQKSDRNILRLQQMDAMIQDCRGG